MTTIELTDEQAEELTDALQRGVAVELSDPALGPRGRNGSVVLEPGFEGGPMTTVTPEDKKPDNEFGEVLMRSIADELFGGRDDA